MSAVHTKALTQFVIHDLLGGRQTIDADDDLLTSGIVDSIGVVRLVQFAEVQFDVSIPLEDVTLDNFGTISDIVHYFTTTDG